MLQRYDWLLFDADDTLFHFDSFAGLQLMFRQHGVDFSSVDYHEYQQINKPLWVAYQNGEIQAHELKQRRFASWAERLQLSPLQLNQDFLLTMAEVCVPLDGCVSLLQALKEKVNLGIITNGFVDLQEARLARHGLREYFDVLVISEQVGSAKPDRHIFEHALNAMGNPPREKVLMVGDNPDSDILGGIRIGFDTCWFNQHGIAAPANISPNYQVASLTELEQLPFIYVYIPF